jgi:hypothetical protein
VLEVTSDSSQAGHHVVAASPVDQNLCQYFVITELPGRGFYTIGNAAATGTFLEPTSPTVSTALTLISSSRRLSDESQEWKLTFEVNVNGWDYYSIESVRYPGNVLTLDETSIKLHIRGQSSQPTVDQHWALIPSGVPPNYPLDQNQDNENDMSTELGDLRDKVAELEGEIVEKDSFIRDKDEEIKTLKELIEALNTSPDDLEADSVEPTTAVVLFDFQAVEDFEMSLVEGEYIWQIERCDDGWWSGVGRGGKAGLFPYHFVSLTEGSERRPPPPEIPRTHVGNGTAIALYDYHGSEDNQVTFREGDTITDLVSENWLRGKSPCGEIGVFPAIYVDIQRSPSQQ